MSLVSDKKNLTEIFVTEKGTVYQCNRQNCLWIEFAGEMTAYKISCFYRLKKLVDAIDLDAMAQNTDAAFDLEIVAPCECERCYILNLSQAAQLKELLAGAKVMLELNSILYERLYSVWV